MSDLGDDYFPFGGLKQLPMLFETPAMLSKLPNFGVYSIMLNPHKNRDDKPREQHFPDSDSQPVGNRQIEYMWNSAVPEKWKKLTNRPFKNLKDKKRDTLQFLVETQKYIHQIRKPQILDDTFPSLDSPKSHSVLESYSFQKFSTGKPSTTAASSTSKIIGDIDRSSVTHTSKSRISPLSRSIEKTTNSMSVGSLRKLNPSFTVPPKRLSGKFFRREEIPHVAMKEVRSLVTFDEMEGTEIKLKTAGIRRKAGSKVSTWHTKRHIGKAADVPFREYVQQTKKN